MSLAHNGNNQLSDSNTGERDGNGENGLSPARPPGHRRDEPARHHDRRLASVEGVDDADARALEGADHRVALRRARAVQSLPQPGRRAAPALAKNGGVVQLVAFRGYVKCDPASANARTEALAALRPGVLDQSSRARRGRRARGRWCAARTGGWHARSLVCSAGGGRWRPRWLRHGGRGLAGRGAAGGSSPAVPGSPARDQREVSGGARRDGEGLRGPHRLRGEAHRAGPRGDQLGLRRRWRRGRLQLRAGVDQRDEGAAAARLHGGADREDLVGEPAARDERGGEDGEADSGGRNQVLMASRGRFFMPAPPASSVAGRARHHCRGGRPRRDAVRSHPP